jgi:hypothetical protein
LPKQGPGIPWKSRVPDSQRKETLREAGARGPVEEPGSMVKVHWGVTFRKTGNRLIEFDITYFLQKTGSEPKIVMFIAHEDEQKAMEELGLLTT